MRVAHTRADTSKPDGQPRRCLDTSKAKKSSGLKQKQPSKKGSRKQLTGIARAVQEEPKQMRRAKSTLDTELVKSLYRNVDVLS
jgi:hypothetical protein